MVLEDFIVLDKWKKFYCQVIYVFKDDSQRALRPCIPKQKHVHFENLGMKLNNQLCFFIKTIQIVLVFAQKAKSHVTCESTDFFFFFEFIQAKQPKYLTVH